ncbi:centrosomal AT-AC splicing factor isoform X1 [Myripristis murdjan]|uniref:Centrosomal AT-AC splicing factor n=1 Tax=Myripristis murdjan TaxID=586833 RepID=A0A667WY53_9TELE|nr:coiled-coil domain-containing protein 84 isoform X1 [Myripristis murdjan]
MGAFYCAVCRQTSFSGKGHIFGKSHQSRLRVVLLKFLEKVKEARRTIKKPQVEKFDGPQHENKFWCYCCGLEIERNVTDGNMTVLHGGLLEHMATPEHKKNTHKFWWENKADPKLRDKVIITEEEIERFKDEVTKVLDTCVEKEDEFIKQQADHIRAQEKQRQEVLQSLIEPEAEQELPNGNHGPGNSVDEAASSHFRPQDQQAGPSWVDPMVDVQWAGLGQALTFIGYQDSTNSGNVHTGAIPPWLQDDPLEGSSGAAAQPEIGPSLQDFLKQKEQEKLRKLPPNRVGANFDHSSHTDANWLPSFGRVWNSGRRWQSRHQFRQEEGQTNRHKRKREHGTDGSKKTKTE